MVLYDEIGVDYDSTRSADPFIASRLLHHLAWPGDAFCLDVGCGTANYTIALADKGVRIAGIDASETMLARARRKRPSLACLRAHAEEMPFASETFASALCTFVHHHLSDPVAAFKEVWRVLRPRARFVLFNCAVEQIRHYWLWEYFPRMMEQAMAPYLRLQTTDALGAAGFRILGQEAYSVTEDLRDWFLQCGKNHPERYFDPRVRAGISAFAAACDREEIERGLSMLRRDMASGRFAAIRTRYDWSGGDYTFTIAER